jgi:hypothetical protein
LSKGSVDCVSGEEGDLRKTAKGRTWVGASLAGEFARSGRASSDRRDEGVDSPGFRLPDVDLALQNRHELLIVLCLAFPNGDRMPSELLEFGGIPFVAGDIALEFLFPELCIGDRVRRTRTIVTMPKAAVDEQRDRPPGEDEIGCTRKITPV